MRVALHGRSCSSSIEQLVFASLTFKAQLALNRIESLLVGKYGVMGKSQDASPIVVMKQIQDAHTGLWITKKYTIKSHYLRMGRLVMPIKR